MKIFSLTSTNNREGGLMITGRVIKRFLNVSMKGIVVTFHILGEFEERCLEKNSDLCIEGAISILKRVD